MGQLGIASETVGNAFSQYFQGKATKRASDYEAQIAENNAFLADQEASWIRRATQERLLKHYREVGQLQASNRVAFAKSGVRLDSGSPLQTAISTAKQAELDADIIRTEGDIAAYQSTLKGQQFRSEADIARFKGKEAVSASRLAIGSSIIKGGADMWDLWQKKKKKGY